MGCKVKKFLPTITGVTVRLLAERLRQLRYRQGLTQEQFAEAAGISYKFYQQIESGRKKQLWLETVERLAVGFGLEAWQLLGPDVPAQIKVVCSPVTEKVHLRKHRLATAIGLSVQSVERELAVAEMPQSEYSAKHRTASKTKAGRRR
jgi:transcriptional regulator with XRE-family HTH domain